MVTTTLRTILRWLYWPDDPGERSALYITSIVLLAVTGASNVGGGGFAFLWPLSVGLLWPLVRLALYVCTTTNPVFAKPPVRRGVFIAAGIVFGLFDVLPFLTSPSIATLDSGLLLSSPLCIAILGGVSLGLAAVDGTTPGTNNILCDLQDWLKAFPLRDGVHGTPREEADWEEWTGQDAPREEEQDIPPFDEPADQTGAMPTDYDAACRVFGISTSSKFEYAAARYRDLTKQYHPDLGTNPRDREMRTDMMKRINLAWDLIKEHHQATSQSV